MRGVIALSLSFSSFGLCPATLHGQGLTLGVKGGVNVASIDVDRTDIVDTSSKTGFVGGGFLSIGIGEVLVLQPELLFSRKGVSVDQGSIDAGVTIDYIDIPLLLKATLGRQDARVHPGLYVGGLLSFETSCEVGGEIGGVTVSSDCEDPIGGLELIRTDTDFGLVFGTDVQVEAGRVIFVADGRYNLGLRDLSAEGGEFVSVKSRVWTFMAGVGVPLH